MVLSYLVDGKTVAQRVGVNFLPDRPAIPMFDIKENEGKK